jgi:hypothetical protein
MPTFETPHEISAVLDLVVADVTVTATERATTSVEVRPTDASNDNDVRVANNTRIEYADGRLQVIAPKHRTLSLFGRPGSVDVLVELPAGSSLRGNAAVATFRGSGRLGECRIRISAGDAQLPRVADLEVNTSAGTVIVDAVSGNARVETGSGRVSVRAVDGTAVLKNSNGDTWVGSIGGELRANTANGNIQVDQAHGDVSANTARGDVRIGSLTRGTASLSTSFGHVEVGIAAGTAAKLDVQTTFGRVDNQLTATDQPRATEDTVLVKARTSFGDVVVRRAHAYEDGK